MSIIPLSGQSSAEELSDAPVVDIIAIHGLYESALETWTDSETGVLWLQTLFPHRQLKARVQAYGYKAETLASPGEGTADRILPHATTLIAELCADRYLANAINRPIIFICHGLGGILVKRALVFSSTSRARNVEHRRSIYISTYAILFMGTPHNGIDKDSLLLPRKGDGVGPSQFMISLLKGSEMLQEVTDQFAPLMKQFSIYCFWEEVATQAGNARAYIVDKESAAPGWDNVDRCGITATHAGMVKFRRPEDPGYRVVLEALMRYIKDAPPLIHSRWEYDLKALAEERQREMETLLQHQPLHVMLDSGTSIDINEWYIVPRCSSNYFTGRKMHAEVLKNKFGPVQRQPARQKYKVIVIYGLGGSGKTQFCLKYVEDNRSSYWGIFWIDASTEENAESSFAYLGQQAGKGATFAAGMHWLSNCSKPWLLVIDNADDPDMDVSNYFPPGGKGHILVTTRNPGAAVHATAGDFRFREMDPEEAITLLLKSAYPPNSPEHPDPNSRKLAQGIAIELGYLALALAQAGATIRRNIYTLERYLHYYLGHRKGMISLPHVKSADDANIITTWEIPFRRIVTRESVEHKDAVDLMHIFAFMHFESISESIFQRSWSDLKGLNEKSADYPDILRDRPVWNEDAQARLRRAVRVLCDYSIIEHDPDKKVCSLHPVVHAWTRDRLSEPEQRRWLSCTAAVLARCISPELEPSGRAFRRVLIPHIDSCLRAFSSQAPSLAESAGRAAELHKFASVYAENGLWKQARTLQRKVVSFRIKKLGRWHEDTIQAQRSLGYTCWNLSAVKSAIELQATVLKSRWWSRPSLVDWAVWPPWLPDHVSYCLALDDLTLTLWLAGKRDLSRKAGERAVKGLERRLGPNDPMTLTAMFNLARTYLHLGHEDLSHGMLVSVVRKRKRFFGPDHPDTLMARNELGMSLCARKRMAAAERLVANVLHSRRRTLGDEHAYTLWSINDLSKVLCGRGHTRAAEAAAMLEAIVPVVARTLGPDHVGMFMTRSNLARAYVLAERWAEADALLAGLTAAIPADHPDWFHAMARYVRVLVRRGRLAAAEANAVALLDRVARHGVIPRDDPRALDVAGQLLRIYRAQGRADEIVALKRRVPGVG